MNLLLESSDSGWNLFLTCKAYLLVGQYILEWILILVLFMSVSEFCLVVLWGFFPSSAFILLNLWLFIIKDFLPFPLLFPVP